MINSRAALTAVLFFLFFFLLVSYRDTPVIKKFFYYHVCFIEYLEISLSLQRNKFVIFILAKFDIFHDRQN